MNLVHTEVRLAYSEADNGSTDDFSNKYSWKIQHWSRVIKHYQKMFY